MVSAWSSEHRLVWTNRRSALNQMKSPRSRTVRNAGYIWLHRHHDAMGTQKSIAEKIIAASDYILSLKDNHPAASK